jgi:hypothetical protein
MRGGEGHAPKSAKSTSVAVSCRLPFEQAQRLFEQADAAGLSHSDYLRALISDAVAAAATAVEAARQETAHAYRVAMNQKVEAVRVETNQTVEAVRAKLGEARSAEAGLQQRVRELEDNIWFPGRELMTAVEGFKLVGSRYKPTVQYWLVRMPRDDPNRILPNLARQMVRLLTEISDQTSTRRADINQDRTKLRRLEWLVWTLSSEIGCSEAGEARPMADWEPAAAALETARGALEKRYELAGES